MAAVPLPVYGFDSPEAAEFPPIIVLENTTVCNLRCVHCPHGQGYTDRPEYEAVYMDWGVYTKVIDEISANQITVLRMASAGESLLHPQFIDQVAYAAAKKAGPINLTTNGVTLDNPAVEGGKKTGKTNLERLLELNIDVIDVSLDAATREKHEAIRVRSNYNRVWGNLHRLLYLREKMRASTKVMVSIIDQPDNHDEVEMFVKQWTPLVDRVIVRGYLENLGLTPYKPGGVVDQVNGVKRWPCPQFWKRVTIAPTGDVRFCVVDWLDKTKLGNVRTHTIKELWKSAEYDRLRRAHLEGRYGDAHSLCGPCTDWCGMRWNWGLEHAIGAVMGNKDVPDKPPQLEPAAA
jgi:radical SAM protein with 4Fe4S-binding SPASM domain